MTIILVIWYAILCAGTWFCLRCGIRHSLWREPQATKYFVGAGICAIALIATICAMSYFK